MDITVLQIAIKIKFRINLVIYFYVGVEIFFMAVVIVPMMIIIGVVGKFRPYHLAVMIAVVLAVCSTQSGSYFFQFIIERIGDSVEIVIHPFLVDKVGLADGVVADKKCIETEIRKFAVSFILFIISLSFGIMQGGVQE